MIVKPTDPTVPGWLRNMCIKQQEKEDGIDYPREVKNFEDAKRDWLKTAQINVDQDLPIPPFNHAIPLRNMFYADTDANVMVQMAAPPDPNLTMPITPSKSQPTAPAAGSGFGFPAVVDPNSVTQKLLGQILTEIARLRADMGLKP